ncbi:MAG TPA: hypothetical protein PK867_09310, partial [Pirellulales bacterium]|nr:hypothetical protein [Pirellulales bacterium]
MLDALDEPLHLPKLDLALWVLLMGISAAAVFGTVRAQKTLARTASANVGKIEAAEKAVSKLAKADRSGSRPNESLIKQVKS